MRLQDKTKIELTGFEIATAIGCFRYILEYKNIGEAVVHLENMLKKLEYARDKEL